MWDLLLHRAPIPADHRLVVVVITPAGRLVCPYVSLHQGRVAIDASAPATCTKPHAAPHPDCSCGVHYFQTLDELYTTIQAQFVGGHLPDGHGFVIASGSPTGRVLRDEHPWIAGGYRCARFDILDVARLERDDEGKWNNGTWHPAAWAPPTTQAEAMVNWALAGRRQ